MDARVVVILLGEAVFCLLLLWFSGLPKKPLPVVLSAVLVVAAFGLRFALLSHVTLDYTNFLAVWLRYFKEHGGFTALSDSVGNYNVPYLYFLALFSYSDIDGLYLIKLLSIFFDVLLAWSAMKLTGLFTRSPARRLLAFFAVLFWPTVVLNGAYWGQCDSIYVAFALMSLWLALDGRPVPAMICMAVSFGFKLQAVFLMPVFVALLFARRVKLRHFLVFPLTYLVLVLPAVLLGRPLMDTLTLYFNQAGSVGSGLNYNSPSIFAFAGGGDTRLLSSLGIAAAVLFTVLVLLRFYADRRRAGGLALLAGALLLAVGIPFLLPHMHDRYFFAADILSLVFAVAAPRYFALPLLCEFASLLGYHAYLKGRYLLPMSWGAAALAAVLIVLLIFVHVQLRDGRALRRGRDA